MLADFVAQHPELPREVDARTTHFEKPPVAESERCEHIKRLLAELVGSLEHNGSDEQQVAYSLVASEHGDFERREVARGYLLEQIGKERSELSPREVTILADWMWAPEANKLSAERGYLSAALNLCPEAIAIVSPEGRLRHINRAGAELVRDLTGISAEDAIGKTSAEIGLFVEAMPPPDELLALARASSILEALVLGRWRELRPSAIYGPDGAIDSVAVICTDVHDRKIGQIRSDLLSKLGRLIGTVEVSELGETLARVPIPQLADWCAVTIVNNRRIEGTFIAQRDPAKAQLRDALLRAAEDLNHHPLWPGGLVTGFQLLSEVSDDMLRKLASNDEQYRLLTQIGVRSILVVPIVSRGQVSGILTLGYTDESGRRYGQDDPPLAQELCLHASHIAENARLVAALRAGQARFRIALAGARTSVFEQDEALRYVWYGGLMSPYPLIGKTHADWLPPDEAKELTRVKQHVLDTGEPVYQEMRLTYTGSPRWYRLAVEVVRDRVGRRTGVIGAATDVTEQKQMRDDLNRALELRERIMGVLGHDLRNPLNALGMAANALHERKDLDPDADRTVLIIERAADRMTEMIETLLDFTRVRFSGKPMPVVRTPGDLSDTVRQIVDEVRAAWPKRTIELDMQGDLYGMWDAPRIAQALSNLTTNALTYGDATRPTRVTADGRSDAIVLSVHNEGPPIPESLLPVLFEPFTRGTADVVSPQGLGLGLFVVKEIVSAHGGTIRVESTAAAGTTFEMCLPRPSPEELNAASR